MPEVRGTSKPATLTPAAFDLKSFSWFAVPAILIGWPGFPLLLLANDGHFTGLVIFLMIGIGLPCILMSAMMIMAHAVHWGLVQTLSSLLLFLSTFMVFGVDKALYIVGYGLAGVGFFAQIIMWVALLTEHRVRKQLQLAPKPATC